MLNHYHEIVERHQADRERRIAEWAKADEARLTAHASGGRRKGLWAKWAGRIRGGKKNPSTDCPVRTSVSGTGR